jgi:hypothetical protein
MILTQLLQDSILLALGDHASLHQTLFSFSQCGITLLSSTVLLFLMYSTV